jgi:hypothetical protein
MRFMSIFIFLRQTAHFYPPADKNICMSKTYRRIMAVLLAAALCALIGYARIADFAAYLVKDLRPSLSGCFLRCFFCALMNISGADLLLPLKMIK